MSKGSVLNASLFLFSPLFFALPAIAGTVGDYQQLARDKNLSSHPTWQALLHSDGHQSPIDDSNFLLSLPNFSPTEELQQSIALLFSDAGPDSERDGAICRFPARYHWLSLQLGIAAAVDPIKTCPAVGEFFKRAPAQRISLVYASENLTSASSMMGHVLIKLSGEDSHGQHREHAISYFTDIRGFNIPKILFESLVVGKPGYYTLSPYREKQEFYLHRERRNIWEYELALDPEQKQLLLLHLVELRPVQLRYFFDRHNCATLTADLIGLTDPNIRKTQPLWTSPLDVVKEVLKAGKVRSITVSASSNWRARMFEEGLPEDVVSMVRPLIRGGEPYKPPAEQPARSAYLGLQLGEAYADHLYDLGLLDRESFDRIAESHMRLLRENYPDLQIDLSQYKTPEQIPQDSQLRIGWAWGDHRSGLRLGILPAAHRLEDDHRQQFSETELRLADLSLRLEPEEGKVDVEEFQLYSMTSLIPFNPVTGGISGRFRLGVEPHLGADLHPQLAANIAGGLGLTAKLGRSIWLYGLAGAGLAAVEGSAYGYLEPEAGLILRPMAPTKSLLSTRLLYNQIGQSEPITSLSWRQAIYMGGGYALMAGFDRHISEHANDSIWQLSVRGYF